MLFLVVIFAGLVLGSFATALIYRIPREISWSFNAEKTSASAISPTRSVCTSCRQILRFRDLIPVYSWLAARGGCRLCKSKISAMYPAVEIAVLVMCVLCYLVKGPTAETFFIILAVPFLVALLVIDLQFLILPNQLIAILAVLGLARAIEASWYLQDIMPFYMAIVSGAVFALIVWLLGLIMTKLLKKEALGFGDVKFFAMAGLWLDIENLAPFCFVAGACGVAFSLFWKMKKGEAVFPFGPALITSFFFILIAGNSFFF